MRRVEVEISVGGSVEELISDLQAAAQDLRNQGVRFVFAEMSNKKIPYSDGEEYQVLCLYGNTKNRA